MSVIDELKGEMIVSCQSEGQDPFNENPEYMALFARAAEMGGAKGIRSQGIEKIQAIKRACKLPMIGLLKSQFEDGYVRITGSEKEVQQLIKIGSDIVAIDGTFRIREGLTGPEFIKKMKEKYGCLILADIATFEEGVACEKAGADCVSTTLSGYTPDTKEKAGADFELIEKLSHTLTIPVFAEGKIDTPADAAKAMKLGAYAVIAGTAITRPRVITQWYVNSIKNIK